jgi:S-adenosylmethionine/arginine decarboxylase-like enzyme
MNMSELRQRYKRERAWGMSLALNLHACDPEAIRDAEKIKQFVIELCELMHVKRFGDCVVVHFGERPEVSGYSMVQLIETSLISGHFANQTNDSYIDIFSCQFYDPKTVVAFAKKFFHAKSCTYDCLIRK